VTLEVFERAIELTIRYEGPLHAGRSTSIASLHARFGGELANGELRITPPVFQPIRGIELRLRLVRDDRKKLDGIVFVADSRIDCLQANIDALQSIESSVPIVFQYNKRDLDSIASVSELDEAIGKGRPRFETIATRGEGVAAAVKDCAARIVTMLKS
jgi:hypothetical protein